MLIKPEVLTKATIRFQGFRHEAKQFARTALQMRTHEAYELIAWIGIHPHTILQSQEPDTFQ